MKVYTLERGTMHDGGSLLETSLNREKLLQIVLDEIYFHETLMISSTADLEWKFIYSTGYPTISPLAIEKDEKFFYKYEKWENCLDYYIIKEWILIPHRKKHRKKKGI